jgi:hypothetical protein
MLGPLRYTINAHTTFVEKPIVAAREILYQTSRVEHDAIWGGSYLEF